MRRKIPMQRKPRAARHAEGTGVTVNTMASVTLTTTVQVDLDDIP
jgi:hypothetical protein